jgi:RNA recognition motif-containing protein
MENADAAVSELNNFFIEGRNIKVDFAQERSRGNGAGFKKGRNRSKPH